MKINKRIIIDIGHPAQVHNFKHVYWDLEKKGWEVLITAKNKEITKQLLDAYNLNYKIIGFPTTGIKNKLLNLPLTILKFLYITIRFNPKFILCRFSPHACWVGFLLRKTVIGIADTEHTSKLDNVVLPFITVKLTSKSYQKDLGKNHIRFDGIIEQFYLNENRFKIKNTVLKKKSDERKLAIVRFVSWKAHHDVGECGFSFKEKVKLIDLLKKYNYDILISAEGELEKEFEAYRLTIPVEDIHDYLAISSLYIGEGASMASEAACLGIPTYYINSLNVGYIDEQVDYKLVKSFRLANEFFNVFENDLSNNINWYNEQNFNTYRKKSIDVSAFVSWFIETYPESKNTMLENPTYQDNFK
jgi:predicted glycosyltransferase